MSTGVQAKSADSGSAVSLDLPDDPVAIAAALARLTQRCASSNAVKYIDAIDQLKRRRRPKRYGDLDAKALDEARIMLGLRSHISQSETLRRVARVYFPADNPESVARRLKRALQKSGHLV